MHPIQCEQCGETTPSHNIVHYGSMEQGYRQLCTQCVNADMAKRCGLDDFENLQLEPIGLSDCAGEAHQFHFRTRLLGNIVSLDAFELRDGNPAGYRFQIIGAPVDDLFTLLGRLIERMRRALAIKHLTQERTGLRIIDQTVRGRIESDQSDEDTGMPMMVVDGRELSWKEFGQMLMAFEGWQFKLDICDRSEEL